MLLDILEARWFFGVKYIDSSLSSARAQFMKATGCSQQLRNQTSLLFQVLLSELPEYNAKIRAGFLLAPAAFVTHSKSSMFRVSPF